MSLKKSVYKLYRFFRFFGTANNMRNLVLNSQSLDINIKYFINFQVQNYLQFFVIFDEFYQNLIFKCLYKKNWDNYLIFINYYNNNL